jgi:SAM-dependent methyltransferase
VVEDKLTEEYFNRLTPHFKPERLKFAIEFVQKNASPESYLIDIGCGDGSTLYLIKEKTSVKFIAGMDVSKEYLKKVESNLNCDIIHGSILDLNLISKIKNSFDFCILGAVLHHIIDNNKKDSFNLAKIAINNSISILKPSGYLLILEPCSSPEYVNSLIFILKKAFSRFSVGRIEIVAKWFNIGHPIVSYYSQSEIESILSQMESVTIINKMSLSKRRFGSFIKRHRMGYILQKDY